MRRKLKNLMALKKFPRLCSAGFFYVFPFVEVLCISIGWLMIVTAANEYTDQDMFGGALLVAGIVHGIVGWPLLFVRVNIFWFDISYLLLGIWSVIYFIKWSAPEITTLGLGTLFLGPGLFLVGFSYSFRRLIAFLIERKRRAKGPLTIVATNRDQA